MVGDGTASELQNTATLQQTDRQTDRHRGNHGVIMPWYVLSADALQHAEGGEALEQKGALHLGMAAKSVHTKVRESREGPTLRYLERGGGRIGWASRG
tara:strand:- start:95 stop:388 length:294 start_codon:yes stop_codon:yes gene_type:complete